MKWGESAGKQSRWHSEQNSQSSLFVLLLRGSLAAAFLFFSLSSIGLKCAKVRMNPLKFTWSSLKNKYINELLHWTLHCQVSSTFKPCKIYFPRHTWKSQTKWNGYDLICIYLPSCVRSQNTTTSEKKRQTHRTIAFKRMTGRKDWSFRLTGRHTGQMIQVCGGCYSNLPSKKFTSQKRHIGGEQLTPQGRRHWWFCLPEDWWPTRGSSGNLLGCRRTNGKKAKKKTKQFLILMKMELRINSFVFCSRSIGRHFSVVATNRHRESDLGRKECDLTLWLKATKQDWQCYM